ncbi:TraB/GumN family protein [Undibacterium sp. Tian12W]|uniref:TraB/GumN family protein n=1 Tax=Undibacterium sp. Tian12W TaxID=3413054 RepID=UPI003BF45C26
MSTSKKYTRFLNVLYATICALTIQSFAQAASGVQAFEVIAPSGYKSVILGSMHIPDTRLRQPVPSVLDGYTQFIVEFDTNKASLQKSRPLNETVIDGGLESLFRGTPVRAPWALDLNNRQISMLKKNVMCQSGHVIKDAETFFNVILMSRSAEYAAHFAMYPCSDGRKSRDEILMNAAIERRVKIVSLDNPDEVDLLRQQIPESFYTSVVKRLLSKEHEYDLRKVVDALNAGDMESLYRFGVGDMAKPEIAAFAKLMIEQRNLLWIPKLIEVLNEGKAFVLVGGAHLSGKTGILNLLRNQGFVIHPVTLPSI